MLQELPYVGEIPGGLKTDMAVVFHAVLPADAKEYDFMFLSVAELKTS